MNTGWSRLEKTAIWNMARRAHEQESWRLLRGFDRPADLYRAAGEVFSYEYDKSLDRAILARCAIVDGPVPVRASAEWLACRLPQPDPEAIALILSTETFAPVSDNRLILLELSDFAFKDSRRKNLELRLGELRARYPEEGDEKVQGRLRSRLTAIADNIDRGISRGGLSMTDRDAFDLILGGILAELLRPTFQLSG